MRCARRTISVCRGTSRSERTAVDRTVGDESGTSGSSLEEDC